jgi:uncharacterized protein (DUF305 family)
METKHKHPQHGEYSQHYSKFAIMIVVSFIAMYVLMYAMVDSYSNMIHNVNQLYMALLMTAAMTLIEIIVMWRMYKNKKLNRILAASAMLVLVASWFFIRKQTAVSDKQFLKSMIPHHAAAVLMVEQTKLNDPELQKLASDIISAQQKEIDFMKAKLKQLENN